MELCRLHGRASLSMGTQNCMLLWTWGKSALSHFLQNSEGLHGILQDYKVRAYLGIGGSVSILGGAKKMGLRPQALSLECQTSSAFLSPPPAFHPRLCSTQPSNREMRKGLGFSQSELTWMLQGSRKEQGWTLWMWEVGILSVIAILDTSQEPAWRMGAGAV